MTVKRISIRDGRFRKLVEGREVLLDSDTLDVVILNAASISRLHYGLEYDPTKGNHPRCWSSDTQVPDRSVPADQLQAASCITCEQNIKGSGVGNSRACKFLQRIAVAIIDEDNLYDVYQLQLPATSLFGTAERGWLSMQNYAKHLARHDTPAIAVVTRICFEQNSYAPRLRFRPMRVLDATELKEVAELEHHPDTLKAITMSVPEARSIAVSPFSEVEGFVASKAI